MNTPTAVVLETLDNLNACWNRGRNNALIRTRSGEVNPDAAYIELVRELLALLQPQQP